MLSEKIEFQIQGNEVRDLRKGIFVAFGKALGQQCFRIRNASLSEKAFAAFGSQNAAALHTGNAYYISTGMNEFLATLDENTQRAFKSLRLPANNGAVG